MNLTRTTFMKKDPLLTCVPIYLILPKVVVDQLVDTSNLVNKKTTSQSTYMSKDQGRDWLLLVYLPQFKTLVPICSLNALTMTFAFPPSVTPGAGLLSFFPLWSPPSPPFSNDYKVCFSIFHSCPLVHFLKSFVIFYSPLLMHLPPFLRYHQYSCYHLKRAWTP